MTARGDVRGGGDWGVREGEREEREEGEGGAERRDEKGTREVRRQ